MLGVNQLDFINYCNALKGNYRKGVHKMETLLENPTHAKEFAKNLGGVSVVLGTPVGKEDRNSETLRSMLLNSDVANDAVYTWLGQFYEFSSWDELLGDEDRCKAMMANELMWRALSASGVAMGKTVATLAGLSCSAYADMGAVAASSTAMTAVINSAAARTALTKSSTARTALKASPLAVEVSLVSSQSQYWNNPGTRTLRGLLLYTKAGNTDNAFTITKVDSTTLTTGSSARNAAISGSTGYKDWLEAFPDYSWVLSSITFYAYYTTTKIKYIPC